MKASRAGAGSVAGQGVTSLCVFNSSLPGTQTGLQKLKKKKKKEKFCISSGK